MIACVTVALTSTQNAYIPCIPVDSRAVSLGCTIAKSADNHNANGRCDTEASHA